MADKLEITKEDIRQVVAVYMEDLNLQKNFHTVMGTILNKIVPYIQSVICKNLKRCRRIYDLFNH